MQFVINIDTKKNINETMASINGGSGKYLHHFTGGNILNEGERYN